MQTETNQSDLIIKIPREILVTAGFFHLTRITTGQVMDKKIQIAQEGLPPLNAVMS